MDYTPSATSIMDRIITLLTNASADGTLAYPYKNYLKDPTAVDAETRFPVAVVTCVNEDFANNQWVVGTFNVDIFYTEARKKYRADVLRKIAHETRRVIIKNPPCSPIQVTRIRYAYGEVEKRDPAGVANLRIQMKYKEQR